MKVGRSTWSSQRATAFVVRAVAVTGPLAVGGILAVFAARNLPRPSSAVTAIVRALVVVVISTVAVAAADRGFRKLLPLSMLLRLSLVFPDRAPSRFKTALRAGSSRRLNALVAKTREEGLDADPDLAAEQVLMLIGALGAHDRFTRGHCERVRLYAHMIGEEMGLTATELQKLQWGALLHDLGKLRVPAEILNKNGKPDEAEWEILRRHPADGEEMIKPLVPFLGEWAAAAGGHHEKWDGTGYPRGLNAANIGRAAAIVAVADAFETMTAVRSYKRPMPVAEARAELTRCAGNHFSPDVVRAFLSLSVGHLRLAMGPLASLAQLPFIGNIATLPSVGSATTALGAAGSAAGSAMAVVALATGLSVSPVTADPVANPVQAERLDAEADAPVSSEDAPATSTRGSHRESAAADEPGTSSNTTTTLADGSPTPERGSSASTTTTSSSSTAVTSTTRPAASSSTSTSSTRPTSTTQTTTTVAGNHAPTAVADAATGKAGTTIHIDVLANDVDIDGNLDPFSVSIVSGPTGLGPDVGSLTVKTRNGHNEVDYQLPGTFGTFTFTYRACDTQAACASAIVTVLVTP